MASIALIYTTIDTLETAKRLSHQAIQEKMAFCANIMPHGLSIYEWEGKTCEEPECYLVFKTFTSKKDLLLKWLKQHHPYQVPVLISNEVTVNASYAQAMKEENDPEKK